MLRRVLAVCTAMLMGIDLAAAAEPFPSQVSWSEFRNQVSQRKLTNRGVRVSLTSGSELKARLLRVEESGIVVKIDKNTKQWSSGTEEATIPRKSVSIVSFSGRVGKGGLIGGLAGLGAGAGVAAVAAVGMGDGSCEGGTCGLFVLAVPALAVAGWLIGRGMDQRAPLFHIQPDRI